MISRIAVPLLALLAAGGCGGSDATDPMSHDASPSSLAAGVTEITFVKWFTAFPAMAGNTSFGAGTFAGEIVERTAFDNGVIVKLQALYSVTDPSHAFTALIQGTQNIRTATAVLNGVITEGWMVGARVHVTFQRITPCALAPIAPGVCFQGTIRIQ